MHQLINPCAPFQYWNTKVHGITARDVRNAPTFAEFWDNIKGFFYDVVVAHNASFDISCLKSTIDFFGLEMPNFDYYCTLSISRKNLPIQNHKLDVVAKYFNLPSFNHHNALDDAITCAKIFHRLNNNFDIASFKKSFGDITGNQVRKVYVPKIVKARKCADIAKVVGLDGVKIQQNDNFFNYADIDFSKSFRVVGRFADMTIGQIESIILRQGGSVVASVDEFPDYIIVGSRQSISTAYGEFEDDVYVGKKAGITIVSERHFLSQIY